jgi:predicted alpha-1,2-mannosidase
MRYFYFFLLGWFGTAPTPAPAQQSQKKQPVDWVNVFTGTSNSRWMLFPGACLPHGMVQLSPDNQQNVWNGGYEYTLGSISGFSHLHEFGLGGVSIMPVVGKLEPYPGQPKTFGGLADGPFGGMWTAGYRSRYRKEDETGKPGYYAVTLLDHNIRTELTATTRCGLMRLTYPRTDHARLMFDMSFPQEEKTVIEGFTVTRRGDREIEGSIRQRNKYAQTYTVHFVTRLSRPFASLRGWRTEPFGGGDTNYGTAWREQQRITPDTTVVQVGGAAQGAAVQGGVMLLFSTKAGEQLTVQTGISYVSIANARLNLDTELRTSNGNFDKVVADARRTWNDLLSTVEITGGAPDEQTKFYTNLYRSYSARSTVSDVNGQYVDPCGTVQQLPLGPPTPGHVPPAMYSADSFWGTQWNLTPLWTLLTPDRAVSWVRSFLELHDRGGWMPDSPTALRYAPVMGAQHHNALLVSSWQKGLRAFDGEKAYAAIRHDLTTPGIAHPCGGFAGNRHQAAYAEKGYVPDEVGPASNTMEYAYDDWCLAQMARSLGKTTDVALFEKRAGSWRNQYDSTTGYVRRRQANGQFVAPFDPHYFGTTGGWNGPGFMEGTAWLYTYFVPHDLPGLVALLGRDRFNTRLEDGFAHDHVDLTNQPNLQAPFLFNYSGKPWLTQRYTRYVVDSLYNTSPYQGWVGEEDEGQLSAYGVLLMMGLFEMDGGCATRPYYDLSSPLFQRITLHLSRQYYGSKTFTIEAVGNSPRNRYIQSARLNGKPITQPRLYHDELVQGGSLVLQMGPKPNLAWGQLP